MGQIHNAGQFVYILFQTNGVKIQDGIRRAYGLLIIRQTLDICFHQIKVRTANVFIQLF